MSVSVSYIEGIIAQAQRAQAAYMLDAVRKERNGEVPTNLYLKTRYLSAAIRILSNTNHGLTNAEIESILHCMIECGEIGDFSTNALTFPAIVVLVPIGGGVRITDLLDGPMGSLVGNELSLLRVNSAGTAWEWTSSATIIGNVSIANTVFVAKNGVDATGLIGRLDKPFLTIAAARTAAVAATPSATNRVLVKVFPGVYLEGIVLANFVDWDLSNSILELQAGSLATIDDNGTACNSIVYGNATINRTTAGTIGGVRLTAASTVTIWCNSITSARGSAVASSAGTLTIYSGNISQTTAGANSYAGAECTGTGIQVIKSNISTLDTTVRAIVYSSSASSIYNSDIITGTVGGLTISAGTARFNGGRIIGSGTNRSAISKSGGTLILNNCTMIATGSGYGITAPSAQSVKVYGVCQTNIALDTSFAITEQVSNIIADSNVA